MEAFSRGKLYENDGEKDRFVRTANLNVPFQILLEEVNPPVNNNAGEGVKKGNLCTLLT
jgi:hypothetical protein